MSARAKGAPEGRGHGRERAVLAITSVAALALCATAVSPAFDPRRAGDDALRRRAEASAEAVRAEWRRMVRAGELGAPASRSFAWDARYERPAPDAAPVPARADDPEGAPGVALLLGLAEQAELGTGTEGGVDLAAARARVESAFERAGLSRGQRALLELRALQLAVRASDAEGARACWMRTREVLDGSEALGETSVLLLAAFAAAPVLSADERRALRAELSSAWLAGRLALPAPGAALARVRAEPPELELEPVWRLAALQNRLAALAPEAGSYAALEARFEAYGTEALERALGELPAAPAAGEGELVDTGFGPLCVRTGPDGRVEAHFADLGRARAELARRARGAGLLPEGFALELDGADAATGERVAGPVTLWGGELAFSLRHRDPRALVRAEVRRASVLRAALVALAVGVAAAGATTFRALGRERRLQELRTRFVADVSHELRTPLAAILMMAENLTSGRVTEEGARQRYHALIGREARRLARLVDDVLDFARIERGERPRVRPEEVELTAFAAALESELGARCAEQGVAFALARETLPERARFDAEAVRRALWNLADNAARHGAGPVEVELAARAGELVCSVRDHGPGLGPAERERAFRPFERFAPDAVAGTGLGLAIVREIARAHGGDARARAPESGAGIVFELRVPLDGPEEGGAA